MKKLIFIILCISGALNGLAQITFQKTYDISTINNNGSCIKQTFDGGYIVTSFEATYSTGGEDVYLMKTDAHGAILWTKTFGGTNTDNGFHIQQTSDSGYIITGYTTSFGTGKENIYMIKTKANGDTLWTKTYGGTSNVVANCVVQTKDGGYIATGKTQISMSNADAYLVKINSNGQMLWSKTFGDTDYDEGFSVQETGNGDIIIAGSSGWADMSLIKTNSSGNILWAKTYGSSNMEFGYSVQQTTDDGFIMLGDAYSNTGDADFYLVKTDSNGNHEWSKTYGGISNEYSGTAKQTIDGGYILTGSTQSFGAGDYDVYLIKTNSAGDTLWTKTYGGSYSEIAGYDCMQQTTDKGYIISAFASSFSTSGQKELYLIKTDSLGNSGCNEFSTQTIVSSPQTVVSSPIIPTSSLGTGGNTTTIVGNGGIATTLCLQLGINEDTYNENIIGISPNPSADFIFVNYEIKTKHSKFEIIDMMGNTVLMPQEIQPKIDISKLSKGLYLLKVTDGELHFAKRFIKE
jgi:hypothetical protein